MSSRPDENPPRLSDIAYQQICDEIVTSELLPGTALSENELAGRLEIGLTPIRDALKRLSLESLVMTYRRRGTFVSEINVADEQRFTEVRVELEGLAAALAARRATSSDFERITKLERAAAAHPLDDPHGYLTAENALRLAIYDATKNPTLKVTSVYYSRLVLRIWHHGLRTEMMELVSRTDQSAIVDAILARDAATARRLAEEQVVNFSASSNSGTGMRFHRGYAELHLNAQIAEPDTDARPAIEFP